MQKQVSSDPSGLSLKTVPRFPGMWKALGPGIVWLALAQGSGELIWWPYIVAKYGLAFVFLMIPACFLQIPVNYQIGTYTLLTGESIFQGFIRLNRKFAVCLWILATLSFLWFGAFASASGTALSELTHFPSGWSAKGQSLFWAYASMIFFLTGMFFSKVIYGFIEKFMAVVSLTTLFGLLFACSHPEVRAHFGEFFKALAVPSLPPNFKWDPADATKLLTAITFAGLGGFWTLFYSYWLREKGAGMSAYMGHITGPITGKREVIPDKGFTFEDTPENFAALKKWKRYLMTDSFVGIAGNIATTLMTCLLAYTLLFPKGLLPDKYQIAVVQAQFFEVSWGTAGKVIFLFVAACFLADTWIVTLDCVSRMHSDFVMNFSRRMKKLGASKCYYLFVVFFAAVTAVTILFNEPGTLILTSAVIGFIGTVIFPFALFFLNHKLLTKMVPASALPGRAALAGLIAAGIVYLALAAAYFKTLFL